MSDSHGDFKAIERATAKVGAVDMWLHAGDYSEDACLLGDISGKRTICVAGNCDGVGAAGQAEEFITIAGYKLWLLHGHAYDVKSGLSSLKRMAKYQAVDIVVYGHTHISDWRQEDGIWFMNPGSVARPIQGTASCGRITFAPEQITGEIIGI